MTVKRTRTGAAQRPAAKRFGVKARAARAPASAKLQAQVKRLMRMRQEKKFAEVTRTGTVAQVNGSLVGAVSEDITPTIAQGDGEGQRIGNSITATGMIFKQQFIKQPAAVNNRRVRTHIVRVLDPSLAFDTVLQALLEVNPLSGVRDYFSNLNYSMMADKRIKIIGTAEASMPTDTPRDDAAPMANKEMSASELQIPISFDDETIRYTADGDTSPTAIRYWAITLCDLGNKGTGTSTADVFVQAASSGVKLKSYNKLWYTDS